MTARPDLAGGVPPALPAGAECGCGIHPRARRHRASLSAHRKIVEGHSYSFLRSGGGSHDDFAFEGDRAAIAIDAIPGTGAETILLHRGGASGPTGARDQPGHALADIEFTITVQARTGESKEGTRGRVETEALSGRRRVQGIGESQLDADLLDFGKCPAQGLRTVAITQPRIAPLFAGGHRAARGGWLHGLTTPATGRSAGMSVDDIASGSVSSDLTVRRLSFSACRVNRACSFCFFCWR